VAIALVLVLGYLTILLNTVSNLGYARDEGFYFVAADEYLKWFRLFASEPSVAVDQSSVDKYWRTNHEHPALIKSLFALSRMLFHDRLEWITERGTAYRLVGMLFSAFAVGCVYVWGKQIAARVSHAGVSSDGPRNALGARVAGIVAALSFALMPRVFYHSHLACFDMPVLAMWLFTSYAYWKSLEHRGWSWALVTALLYGLLLNTKHNSWLLPFALLAHWACTEGVALVRSRGGAKFKIPKALPLMATLSPLLFFSTWPWIWFDTLERLQEYVTFHTQHVFYNMEFLGQTYFRPPFPRLYAWLMTLGTVPTVTLALSTVGVGVCLAAYWRSYLGPLIHRVFGAGSTTTTSDSAFASTTVLFGLCVLVSYAPWLSNKSPIFGGTKHWITAYPYLCLFGAIAFVKLCEAVRRAWQRPKKQGEIEYALAACLLLGPLVITVHSHPWGLSAYTPVVGGAPGAASLGLNRSFWGYTTGAVQDAINQLTSKNGRVFVHDTALQSFRMMMRDGRLRGDLRPQLEVAGSTVALYHHEQHMARVEHQIWVDYGTVRPKHVAGLDGVPVVWLYARPRAHRD
jgi:4-amino-4-deoxy-L-arabinose transferase-like glycosyltransferase